MLVDQCIAASATPLLQQCAGYAKKAAPKAKAVTAKVTDDRIEGKNQKLLKVL